MAPCGSAEQRDRNEIAPDLRRSLLAWWEVHGRKEPALKLGMLSSALAFPHLRMTSQALERDLRFILLLMKVVVLYRCPTAHFIDCYDHSKTVK